MADPNRLAIAESLRRIEVRLHALGLAIDGYEVRSCDEDQADALRMVCDAAADELGKLKDLLTEKTHDTGGENDPA